MLAGEVADEVRLVLPHESALVRQLVAHGSGNGEERAVHVDVRFHGEGEVHAGDVGVAHELGEQHGLGRGVERTGKHRVGLGQRSHVFRGLAGVGLETAAGCGVAVGTVVDGRPGVVHLVGQVLAEGRKLGRARRGQVESGVLGEGEPVVVEAAHEREEAVTHGHHRQHRGRRPPQHEPPPSRVPHQGHRVEDEPSDAEREKRHHDPLRHRPGRKRGQKAPGRG